MPLFRRADGTLVPGLPAARRIMPYIMRGRNESAVYVETRFDVSLAKKWLWAYNRALPDEPCTFLQLFLFSLRIVLAEHPELDRFVSGRRIYQRKVFTTSLVVRESLDANSRSYVAKLPSAKSDESLPVFSRRIAGILRNAHEHQQRTEQEMSILLRLPDCLVQVVMRLQGLLDECNLLPSVLIRDDPLYTSVFVANLGSLGLPDTFHHLYEYGTCSVFAVIAALQKVSVSDWDGTTEVREILPIRWTVDDRIADGFVYAAAFRSLQSYMEDPAKILGSPEEAARGVLPSPVCGKDALPAVAPHIRLGGSPP
jgi:hypothetical protein